jgi:hypothetical protein
MQQAGELRGQGRAASGGGLAARSLSAGGGLAARSLSAGGAAACMHACNSSHPTPSLSLTDCHASVLTLSEVGPAPPAYLPRMEWAQKCGVLCPGGFRRRLWQTAQKSIGVRLPLTFKLGSSQLIASTEAQFQPHQPDL